MHQKQSVSEVHTQKLVFSLNSQWSCWVSGPKNAGLLYLNSRYHFITRAPLGGGVRLCPLLVFQNNSKGVADIDAKFGVPNPTLI